MIAASAFLADGVMTGHSSILNRVLSTSSGVASSHTYRYHLMKITMFLKEDTHPKYCMGNPDALFSDVTYDWEVFLGNLVHQLGKIVASLFEFFTLGAEGVLPSRHIESFLRVFKQFTHTLPSRQVVGYLSICPPL